MNKLTLGLAAACVMGIGAAQATPTVYTDRAAFDAALSALGATPTTQGFEGIDPALRGTNLPDQDPAAGRVGATIDGLGMSSPQPFGVQFAAGDTLIFTGFSNSSNPAARNLVFTLPTGSIAFGIDLIDYQSPDTPLSDPLTITGLGVSQVLDTTPTQATPSFFGVIDPDGSTTGFTISRTARVLYPLTFDDVSYAAAPAAVPEPASLAMLGAGLLALAAMRRTVKRGID